jgi:hypothetical protein
MGPIQVDIYLYKAIRLIAHAADGRPSGSSLQAGEQVNGNVNLMKHGMGTLSQMKHEMGTLSPMKHEMGMLSSMKHGMNPK